MAPHKYRVQAATYNNNLGNGLGANPDLSSWLIPTLADGGSEYSGEGPPDFVAIGLQEALPLHLALAGLTQTALDLHDYKMKASIEDHASTTSSEKGGKEAYTLVAKKVLGGISLLVYTRDKTVTAKVVDVRVATAACGIFNLMGNKGAVGVRIVLDDGEEEDDKKSVDSQENTGDSVFTFVNAHLAAHDSGLQRRNEDYKSIVERLVFNPDEASEYFQPKRTSNVFAGVPVTSGTDAPGIGIYDTSYLFFFGDLNYRISTKSPKPLPLHLISHKLINDLPSLLAQDQLTQELSAGKTLHHLREGPITFKPTYKYKPGTVNEFKKFTKRVPGWCDRVLFATWADGEEGAGTIVKKKKKGVEEGEEGGKEKVAKRKGARVELYRSLMEFTQSDHKPVTAIIACPRHPKGSRALRLPWSTPFAIDPLWRRKQLVGWILDRFVGFWWCIIMVAGFGRDARLGVTTLASAAVAAWYYRAMVFGI